MNRTLAVMAKWPEPGRVKTRLAAETSPEWAAGLARAFLLDTLHRVSSLAVRRIVAFDPPEAEADFRRLADKGFELVPQIDGDLGSRMAAVVQAEFACGAQAVVLIGTDSPSLPVEHVAQAFAELARADVVIGPSTDGGYYLIGMTRPFPQMFQNIDWSGPTVLDQTIQRLESTPCRLALLPPWFDVDDWADFQMLVGHLRAIRRTGTDPRLPYLDAFLQAHPGVVPPN